MSATSDVPDQRFTNVIERLCLEAAQRGVLVSSARAFRVSSSQPSQFIANLNAGLKTSDQADPDVIAAREIGGLLVERSVEGAIARLRHGTVAVTPSMLTERDLSTAVVGYVTLIGSTLFVYLMTSAAAANLDDADAPEDRGNAAVDTFRQLMRAASVAGRQVEPTFRLKMYFADETRACRSRNQGSRLIATIKRYRVRLFLRGNEWNVLKTTDEQIVDMLLGMAATERDLSVARLVKGKVSLLAVHRLPEALGSNVPFTHVAYSEERTDEHGTKYTKDDVHRPVPAPGATTRLTRLVRHILGAWSEARDRGEQTIDWSQAAQDLAEELDLRDRSPEACAKPERARLISELSDPGGALKRLIGSAYREAWRTGRLPWVTKLSVEVEGLQEQAGSISRDEEDNAILTAWVECPIPPGLEVTDDEWDELDALLAPNSARAGRPPSGWQRPLRSTREIAGEREWEVCLTTDGCYRLESRRAEAAANGAKKTGWPRNPRSRAEQDVQHHDTANAHTLHCAVGSALEELAVGLEGQVLALNTRRPERRNSDNARAAVLERRIEDLMRLAEDNGKWADGARLEMYRCAADGDEAGRAMAAEDAKRFKASAQEAGTQAEPLRVELAGLRVSDPGGEDDDTAMTDLSSVEQVAAALQTRWSQAGTVPPEVVTAVRRIFRRSLKLESVGGRLNWSVTAFLRLSDDRLGTYELTGSIAPVRRGKTAESNTNVIARMFLWDGLTHAEIGKVFDVDGSGKKNSYLLQRLKGWLAPGSTEDRGGGGAALDQVTGIASVDLRRALLDAPPITRRTAYAIAVGDEGLLDGQVEPGFIDLIRATYFEAPEGAKWSESWTAADWRLPRRLMAMILRQASPSEGIGVMDAAAALGVDYRHIVALTGERAVREQSRRTPAVFSRSWERTDRSDVDARRVYPKNCPWPKCAGRGAGVGSRKVRQQFVPAAHVLFVPEVPLGLVCPSCRRVPDLEAPFASVRLPDDYLLGHRRRTKAEDGTRSGSRIETAPWWTPWRSSAPDQAKKLRRNRAA